MKNLLLSFLFLSLFPVTAMAHDSFPRHDHDRITHHRGPVHPHFRRHRRGPLRRFQCYYRGRFGQLKLGRYKYDRFGRLYCGKVGRRDAFGRRGGSCNRGRGFGFGVYYR